MAGSVEHASLNSGVLPKLELHVECRDYFKILEVGCEHQKASTIGFWLFSCQSQVYIEFLFLTTPLCEFYSFCGVMRACGGRCGSLLLV